MNLSVEARGNPGAAPRCVVRVVAASTMGGATSVEGGELAAAVSRASEAELGAAVSSLAPADRCRLASLLAASAEMPYEKKFVTVVPGKRMAYVDAGGAGDGAVVFLHGNPTSSYMWRNVIGDIARLGGRVVAPDLMGMGDSDKIDDDGAGGDRYSLDAHAAYVDAFLAAVAPRGGVVLVGHSWGATLAAHWARRHGDRVRRVAVMECAFTPFTAASAPPHVPPFVAAIRSDRGEAMVLEDNVMIEHALPGGVARPLADEVLARYRAPFAERGEARRAMLSFARAIPLDGEPADVARLMLDARAWLEQTDVPKLLILGDPGSTMTPEDRDRARAWPNVTEATVAGKHLLTEDSPVEIGAAIARWWVGLDRGGATS